MYIKKIPYKNFKGEPRNAEVAFNLTEREIFKLLPQLQAVFSWREVNTNSAERELVTEEVIEFYNHFEEILLSAWGEPSADGEHFRKAGRYDFEESALFNAAMLLFVTDPEETGRLLDGLMPSDMQETVKRADANFAKIAENENLDDESKQKIAELQRQLAEAQAGKS